MDADAKLYRLIYALLFDIDPPPDCIAAQIVVWLGRDGMPLSDIGNGLPRPPKQRTIDLREGDGIRVNSLWRKVLRVRAYRDGWRSGESWPYDDGIGYLYRPSDRIET